MAADVFGPPPARGGGGASPVVNADEGFRPGLAGANDGHYVGAARRRAAAGQGPLPPGDGGDRGEGAEGRKGGTADDEQNDGGVAAGAGGPAASEHDRPGQP